MYTQTIWLDYMPNQKQQRIHGNQNPIQLLIKTKYKLVFRALIPQQLAIYLGCTPNLPLQINQMFNIPLEQRKMIEKIFVNQLNSIKATIYENTQISFENIELYKIMLHFFSQLPEITKSEFLQVFLATYYQSENNIDYVQAIQKTIEQQNLIGHILKNRNSDPAADYYMSNMNKRFSEIKVQKIDKMFSLVNMLFYQGYQSAQTDKAQSIYINNLEKKINRVQCIKYIKQYKIYQIYLKNITNTQEFDKDKIDQLYANLDKEQLDIKQAAIVEIYKTYIQSEYKDRFKYGCYQIIQYLTRLQTNEFMKEFNCQSINDIKYLIQCINSQVKAKNLQMFQLQSVIAKHIERSYLNIQFISQVNAEQIPSHVWLNLFENIQRRLQIINSDKPFIIIHRVSDNKILVRNLSKQRDNHNIFAMRNEANDMDFSNEDSHTDQESMSDSDLDSDDTDSSSDTWTDDSESTSSSSLSSLSSLESDEISINEDIYVTGTTQIKELLDQCNDNELYDVIIFGKHKYNEIGCLRIRYLHYFNLGEKSISISLQHPQELVTASLTKTRIKNLHECTNILNLQSCENAYKEQEFKQLHSLVRFDSENDSYDHKKICMLETLLQNNKLKYISIFNNKSNTKVFKDMIAKTNLEQLQCLCLYGNNDIGKFIINFQNSFPRKLRVCTLNSMLINRIQGSDEQIEWLKKTLIHKIK